MGKFHCIRLWPRATSQASYYLTISYIIDSRQGRSITQANFSIATTRWRNLHTNNTETRSYQTRTIPASKHRQHVNNLRPRCRRRRCSRAPEKSLVVERRQPNQCCNIQKTFYSPRTTTKRQEDIEAILATGVQHEHSNALTIDAVQPGLSPT